MSDPEGGGKEDPFNWLIRLLCLFRAAWVAHMVGPLRLSASLWAAEHVVLCFLVILAGIVASPRHSC